jgi:glycosyltransferase involved in cell wall biosynthesis
MDWREKCAVVIPCLNEQDTIGPLVHSVKGQVPSVFVVDDCSEDQTGNIAKESGASVLRHDRNLGKGAALNTGWQHALRQGYSWAFSLDGDGQHSADDIPKFIGKVRETSPALVIGNRMGEAHRIPAVRRMVNRWMSRRISKIAGVNLPDSQCGFRLMNLDRWRALRITRTHFEIESEVLLAFVEASLRVDFVPIQVIYRQHRSKIKPFRDTLRWLDWWLDARKLPTRGSL